MPLPNVSGAYRVILEFSNVSGGKNWTVSHDWLEDTQDNTLAQELADAWPALITGLGAQAVLTNDLNQYFRSEVDYVSATVYPLGTGAAAAVNATPTAFGVQNTEAPLPPDIAMVVSKRTEFRGRSGRGRMYWAGMSVGAMDGGADNGLYLPALVGAMQDWWNAFISSGIVTASGTFRPVIITPQTAPEVGPWIPLARSVTNYAVDIHPDVQRRRGQR